MKRFLNMSRLLFALILLICQFKVVSGYTENVKPLKQVLQLADFSTTNGITIGCYPFTVGFQDANTNKPGNIIALKWYFGDGDSSSLTNPIHTYTKPGVYDVILKITTDSGYTDQVTKSAYITCVQGPSANFSATPSFTYLSKPKINFENLTLNETASTTYSWYFDDYSQYNYSGGISNLKNPIYVYSDTAHYQIMLVATNNIGCSDTAFREVVVIEDPYLWFPALYIHKSIRSVGCIGGVYYYEYYPIDVLGAVEMHVQIFNMTGQLVFSSDKPKSTRWEASYLPNNSPGPSTFYIIRVKYKGFDNIWYTKTGKVIVER
jgi:hypothetical protein